MIPAPAKLSPVAPRTLEPVGPDAPREEQAASVPASSAVRAIRPIFECLSPKDVIIRLSKISLEPLVQRCQPLAIDGRRKQFGLRHPPAAEIRSQIAIVVDSADGRGERGRIVG